MLGLRERLISITLKPLRRVKNARSALAFLDLLIFLAIGGILSALATGALEIRYEKNFDDIQNLKRENFILSAAKQNTENDQMFYLVFLSNQEDYFRAYADNIFEGWALETEARFNNIFFGFERLIETQRTIIKLAPEGSKTIAASKARIGELQQIKKDSQTFVNEVIRIITPEKFLDLSAQASTKNREFFDKINTAIDITIKDVKRLIRANDKQLKSLRDEQSVLNWWASNIFLFSFLLQIIIFAAYHCFEIFFDRRANR